MHQTNQFPTNKSSLWFARSNSSTQPYRLFSPTHQNSLIMPAPVVDCEDEMKNPTLHSRFSKKSSSLIHQSSLRVPEKSRPSNLGQSQPAQFSEDSYIHITSPTNCHPITRFLHLYDIVLTGTLVTQTGFYLDALKQFNSYIQVINMLFISVYIPLQISLNLANLNYLFISLKVIDFLTIFHQLKELNKSFLKHYIKPRGLLDLLFICSLLVLLVDEVKKEILWVVYIVSLLSQISGFWQNFRLLKIRLYSIFSYSQLFLKIFEISIYVHNLTTFNLIYFPQKGPYYSSLFKVLQIMTFNLHDEPKSLLELLSLIILIGFSCFILAYIVLSLSKVFNIEIYDQVLGDQIKNYTLSNDLIFQMMSAATKESEERQRFKFSNEIIQTLKFKEQFQIIQTYFPQFSNCTIQRLVEAAEEIECRPNQIIVQENTVDDESIFFIIEGTFRVSLQNTKSIAVLQKSQHFGELSFYTQQARSATVVCDSHAVLLKLTRQACISQLSFSDKQWFYQRKDEIVFSQRLPNKCFCCSSNSHVLKDCPKLQYKPDLQEVIRKQSIESRQPRYLVCRGDRQRAQNKYQLLRASESLLQDLKLLFWSYQIESLGSDNSELPYEEQSHGRTKKTMVSHRSPEMPQKLNQSQQMAGSAHLQTNLEPTDNGAMQNLFNVLSPIQKKRKTINMQRHSLDTQLPSIYEKLLPCFQFEQPDHRQQEGTVMELLKKSSLNNFQNLEIDSQKFNSDGDFERLYNFQTYFPEYNVEATVEKINRLRSHAVKSSTSLVGAI